MGASPSPSMIIMLAIGSRIICNPATLRIMIARSQPVVGLRALASGLNYVSGGRPYFFRASMWSLWRPNQEARE